MNLSPWLQNKSDQWLALLLSKQVPHAVLLSGAAGLGKVQLAQNMAQLALCESISEKGFCNTCIACELYKVGNHPDVTVIRAEKTVIKVEQIRQLTRNVTLSSTRSQHRVIVIEKAEQMNKASANAILKTLEEPPSNVVIILTTSEIGHLLPTIKSRCIKLNISTPEFEKSRAWLNNHSDFLQKEINLALVLSNGSPYKAKQLLQENNLDEIKKMLSELSLLSHGKTTVLEIAKNWHVNEFDVNFPFLATYFLAMLKSINSMNYHNELLIDININDYDHIVDLNSKLLKFVKKIFQFIKRSQTPLKKELLLEELLINWQSDFKKALQ